MPTVAGPDVPSADSCATMHTMASPPVTEDRRDVRESRLLSDRIAVGRALWRDLVIGFAAQLGRSDLGFTQLAALYAISDTGTLTVAELAERIGRSASAASRVATALVRRGLLDRAEEETDRRQRALTISAAGLALLATIDRARADQFLDVVRRLPFEDRALVAMAVAALADGVITRRGRLRRAPSGV